MNMSDAVCTGFEAAGITAGIKKNGKKDLGILYSSVPARAAAVFTRNLVQAAPVLLDRERIKSGRCRAVVVNSGCANCCTGEQGLTDAKAMAGYVAAELGIDEDLVLVASTGVIGEPLPMEKIQTAVPELVAKLTPGGIPDLAEAIMTTDTVPKMVTASGRVDGKSFSITGVAKGSGMIRPDMATMLCFVATDADVAADMLQSALAAGVDRSLNRITIDGDTSTNDTVILMAGGMSNVKIDDDGRMEIFQQVLDEVLIDLARALVKDGEGVTKLVEIKVNGAVSDKDARRIADTVAHSNLLKTAFFGEDANWGRILAAAGRAGAPMEIDRTDVFFDDAQMVKDGIGCGKTAEDKAAAVMKKEEFRITIDLKTGTGSASVLTCDFSIDYVKINADYRS
ncbi:MAG: bifunctional ornithine acetyltransferase/N-acetylglutamate synthase [Desulfobacteraceae bacterium 4572_123]|nr:MAG: bifunctional ornithine acetyltransferase/N-acetylglutamate synthase [Desulfobacteraceae bacterium 4572_123]